MRIRQNARDGAGNAGQSPRSVLDRAKRSAGYGGERPGGGPPARTVACVADPSRYRPAPGEIPEEPGVYRFRDDRGRVIYVGKAKSLRQRLNQYFADFTALHPRTQAMLTTAAKVD